VYIRFNMKNIGRQTQGIF